MCFLLLPDQQVIKKQQAWFSESVFCQIFQLYWKLEYQSAQHFYTSGLVFKYKSLNGWKGPIICGRYIIHKVIYISALANLIQFSLLFSSQSLCSLLSRSFVCVFSLCIAALLVLEMSASLQVFMGKRSSGGWGSSIWQTNFSSTRLTQLTCCINALHIVINLHDV